MQFNDKEFEAFEEDVEEALSKVCDKYQVTLTSIGYRYGKTNFELKLDFEKDDEEAERIKFEEECESYGFQKSDYKREVFCDNQICEFIGFNPRARKYKCIVRSTETGERFVLTEEQLRDMFDYYLYDNPQKLDLDNLNLLTDDDISFLTIKIQKSKQTAKDWAAIKGVFAGKHMFTFIPDLENDLIENVDSMSVEAGYGIIFFDEDDLVNHVGNLTYGKLVGERVRLKPMTYEEFIEKADKNQVPIRFLMKGFEHKACFQYDPADQSFSVFRA